MLLSADVDGVLHLSGDCFFFNDTATTEIYTLSLHDALPISSTVRAMAPPGKTANNGCRERKFCARSEEHTSELQSQSNLVCRLLLEKKNMGRFDGSLARQGVLRRVPPPYRTCSSRKSADVPA